MSEYPDRLKRVSNRKYVYGDFDKDGVKNIDDPKPFDRRVSHYPSIKKNPTYYHKARYGGASNVLLSDELRAIERNNNRNVPIMKTFLRENPKSFGRIKTVPSTMKKLRERHIGKIMDTGGATILTKKRRGANTVAARVKKKYPFDRSQTDDYYKKPKGGVYYAHHVGVMGKRGGRLEVQVKSKKMFELQARMHEAYKRGKSLDAYRDRARRLFLKGY